MTAYFHKKGIKFSIYIEDGRILANSPEQAEEFRVLVLDSMKKAGWQVSYEKSDGPGMASQMKMYLGFVINTSELSVSNPVHNLDAFCKLIGQSLEKLHIPVKELARSPCHLLMATVFIFALGLVGGNRVVRSRRTRTFLFCQCGEKFQWCPDCHNLNRHRSGHIACEPVCVTDHCLGSRYQYSDCIGRISNSQVKPAVKWPQGQHNSWTSTFQLTPEEQLYSSGERELLAVHKFLQDLERKGSTEVNEGNVVYRQYQSCNFSY